jgi:RNA polymerase sigma-70 factor (ECF subfamily)
MSETARNLALDSVKRAENRLSEHWDESEEAGLSHSGVLVDETFECTASSEEFGHFCEAVRQLPLQARRVFVLKKVYGYSQREIASELGIAESTVEKHVALAVRRCAAYLKEEAWQGAARIDQVEAHHE